MTDPAYRTAKARLAARAREKAKKTGLEVSFSQGVVESLPFPDAHFDAVLSTLMLHHLPRKLREQCAREVRRVLKPGGRVLVVDFREGGRKGKGLLTAVGNDTDFSRVFVDQLDLLGRPGDIALGISTSGASANVNRALKRAREKGLLSDHRCQSLYI